MSKINVAVVGLGTGRRYLAALGELSCARLVAICDVDGEKLNRYTAEYGVKGVTLPKVASYANRMIYNQYSILVADGKRDALRAFLGERQIGCNVYYPLPLHLQECFAYLGGKEGDYPVSEKVAKEILALPIYPESTEEQRREVVSAIAEFMNR